MIEFYTAPTPNCHKVSILLEELSLPYEIHYVSLTDDDQKQPTFLALNPNGRVPVIIDNDFDNQAIFESGAILIHLAEQYQQDQQFLATEPKTRATIMQWLMFQMSGVGPMQGQANVFYRYAEQKIPYAIDRYQNECRRLYQVLDKQLTDQAYIAGDYSIADMATYPWIKMADWAGINTEGFDHLQRWLDRLDQRPAVQKGMAVPFKVDLSEQQTNIPKQGQGLLNN